MRNLFCFLLVFVSFNGLAQNLDRDKLLEYYQNQKYDEAADYVLSVYPATVSDLKVLAQVGTLRYLANNLPEAERIYLSINAIDSNNFSALNTLARISVRREDYRSARKYFEKIIETDSTNFNVYRQLADIIPTSEAPVKLKYLLRANLLRPADADVAMELAELYASSQFKMPEKSERILDFAINADSSNIALLKAKLPVSFLLKKYDDVVRTGEKLLVIADTNIAILNTLGKAYYFLKDYAKAIKMFTGIDKSDQTEGTYYYITLCYKQLGDYKTAITFANATIASAISPNVSNYYSLLGALNESSKQPATAIAAYKKGLQFNDHDAIYYSLGLLYSSLKNKAQAKLYFKKFLAGNIDKEDYAAELKYVRQWLAAAEQK